MLPVINSNQLVTIYMTTQLNEDRLIDLGPVISADNDGSSNMSTIKSARYWDIYKDIVQFSMLHQGTYTHYLMCDGSEKHNHTTVVGNRKVILLDSERSIIENVMTSLWSAYGGDRGDGKPMFQRYLVGWRTHLSVWPMLVNRALRYNVKVLPALLTDPEKKWPTIYSLVDVAGIYLQGSGNVRDMPGLPDLLRYWECVDNDKFKPMPADLASTVCDEPGKVVELVEPYLQGMHNIVMRYYPTDNMESGIRDSELAGMLVPESMPVWDTPSVKVPER